MQVSPPTGTPFSVAAPPELVSSTGGAVEVTSASMTAEHAVDDVDDVIDLRSDVPTPYGGRLADLEAMLQHW